MTTSSGRLRDPQQRAERATGILDTAAELLLRHGYRRVSIDDVAVGAGIGKGTVYLHWKTREQLFSAVFAREVLAAVGAVRDALRDDPETCLLDRFARTYFLAVLDRPLLRGFLLADPQLLGKLAEAPGTAREARHADGARRYVELLAHHGLVRDDLSPGEIGYAYQATFEGFLRAEEAPDAEDALDDTERRADLLADVVRRSLGAERTPVGTVLDETAGAVAGILDDLIAADREELGIPEVPATPE
ncbi:TetR/AcrR family transcriptional regulator [Streptomyces sp. NPDC058955]|uniref:TetR/AcrR family transcriptional regulator n=1 Tax=unclassified Streptomyces TaxID=2593676 RepID=UPI003661FBE2